MPNRNIHTNIDSLNINWDERHHITGQSVPANARMYGLVVLDWTHDFQQRLQMPESELVIPFQYIEQIPVWTKTANYSSIDDVMGRFEGMSIYANSSAQEFSLVLTYHAESYKNSYNQGTHWTLENIETYAKRLKASVYPQYDGKFSPPVKYLFNIGNIYRDLPIIIRTVTVEDLPPFHTKTGLSMMKKITLECKTVYPQWQSLSQVTMWKNDIIGGDLFAYESFESKNKYKK